MRIKPASGLKVRDNTTRQLLPQGGIDVADTDGVPNDPYWQRLLRDKDVEVVPAAPAPAPAKFAIVKPATPAPEPARAALEAPADPHGDEDHPEADQPTHGS